MKLKEKIMRNIMSGNCTRNIWLFIPRRIKKIVKATVKKIDLYIQTYARRKFGKNIPVKNNKILFINFQGMYTCNQAAIAQEIINQKLDCELVFTCNK